MDECIICFDVIDNITKKNNIHLECCNNYVHDYCLQQWISSNINKNKDINLCIYCKKNNITITNIINNYKQLLSNINTEIIVNNIYNSNNTNNNNNSNSNIIITENTHLTKKITIISSFLIFLFFLYFYIFIQ